MQHVSGRVMNANNFDDKFKYKSHIRRQIFTLCAETIISPFDSSGGKAVATMAHDDDDDDDDYDDHTLALTRENVEVVLDEMRPFLQADG